MATDTLSPQHFKAMFAGTVACFQPPSAHMPQSMLINLHPHHTALMPPAWCSPHGWSCSPRSQLDHLWQGHLCGYTHMGRHERYSTTMMIQPIGIAGRSSNSMIIKNQARVVGWLASFLYGQTAMSCFRTHLCYIPLSTVFGSWNPRCSTSCVAHYGQQHIAGASFSKVILFQAICVFTRGQIAVAARARCSSAWRRRFSMSLTDIRCAKYKACIHNYQERWIVGDDAKRLSRLEIPHIFANDGCVGQIRNLVFSGCCIAGSDEDDPDRNAMGQTQSVASVCSFLCISMYFYSFFNPECGFWYVAFG